MVWPTASSLSATLGTQAKLLDFWSPSDRTPPTFLPLQPHLISSIPNHSLTTALPLLLTMEKLSESILL